MAAEPPPLGAVAAQWARERRVAVGGTPVRYREAGTGPPLVLLHGLGMSSDYWHRVGPPLAAAGYRVLAADVPGFGRTPGPRDALDIGGQADATAAWADALALPPAAYLGHSLSCQVVVELAARCPERVRGLVLAAPTGHRSGGGIWLQGAQLLLDAVREPPVLIALAAQAYLRAGPRRYWQTWHHGARHDVLARLPAVRAPALVVLGGRDPIVQRDYAHRLAAALPAGRVVTIAGAPHAAFFRYCREFNAAVERFLRSLSWQAPTAPAPAIPAAPPPPS